MVRSVVKKYQVMAEFAIGFPILLLLFFAMLQLIIIYADHIVVKYAAYKAARAYVSSSDIDNNETASYDPISQNLSGPITDDDRAHLAAAMITTPLTFNGKPDLVPPLPAWWTLPDGGKIGWPGWSNAPSAKKQLDNLEDAWYCTNVRIIGDDHPNNPNANRVTVEVDHDLKLIFPFVDVLFATAQSLFASDYTKVNSGLAPEYQKTYSNQKYYRVTERSVLPIQNISESKYENN